MQFIFYIVAICYATYDLDVPQERHPLVVHSILNLAKTVDGRQPKLCLLPFWPM